MTKNSVVILGATASGKTRLAVRLAHELEGEIISADSRQVYIGMDIGTGKDLKDYIIDNHEITYHLIDIIRPQEEFNLFEFQHRFFDVFSRLIQKKVLPVLVGGTGLYLESVINNYWLPPAPVDRKQRAELESKTIEELREILQALKPKLHNKTDLENKGRLIRAIEVALVHQSHSPGIDNKPNIDPVVIGVCWDRSILRKRITDRLKQRLDAGMIDEVSELRRSGVTWARLEKFGLEYRYLALYLQKKISYEEMFAKLNTNIHQFAKRQETWFRRMEKKGIIINWIKGDDYELLKEKVLKAINE